jgi:hypothetical protein
LIPRASTSRSTEISRFIRSTTSSGTRAIVFRPPLKNLSSAFYALLGIACQM